MAGAVVEVGQTLRVGAELALHAQGLWRRKLGAALQERHVDDDRSVTHVSDCIDHAVNGVTNSLFVAWLGGRGPDDAALVAASRVL